MIKNKLYSYGNHRVFSDKLPWLMKKGWYLTSEEKSAIKRQQKQMEWFGWGRDRVTFWGAEAIIQQLVEYATD